MRGLVVMPDLRIGWKVLTHDYRSPIQGGEVLWDGHTLPWILPTVALDTATAECAAGWNYAADLLTALRSGGFWPDGWPSTTFLVDAAADAIERGEQRRTSGLILRRQATDGELAAAIGEFSQMFAPHADRMAAEQLAWRQALARPTWDHRAVGRKLQQALAARGEDHWRLQEYAAAPAAWTARDALAAGSAPVAWAARAAWETWKAKEAWVAWAARDAWVARAACAWDAWAARAASDALTVQYVRCMGWQAGDPLLLTTGIREAYAAGLALAVPVAPQTLGWAMTTGLGSGRIPIDRMVPDKVQ